MHQTYAYLDIENSLHNAIMSPGSGSNKVLARWTSTIEIHSVYSLVFTKTASQIISSTVLLLRACTTCSNDGNSYAANLQNINFTVYNQSNFKSEITSTFCNL